MLIVSSRDGFVLTVRHASPCELSIAFPNHFPDAETGKAAEFLSDLSTQPFFLRLTVRETASGCEPERQACVGILRANERHPALGRDDQRRRHYPVHGHAHCSLVRLGLGGPLVDPIRSDGLPVNSLSMEAPRLGYQCRSGTRERIQFSINFPGVQVAEGGRHGLVTGLLRLLARSHRRKPMGDVSFLI